MSGTNEHQIWKNIRNRCNNPKTRLYAWYGGRGIKICDRWQKFENFFADMGPRPSKGHSVERKNNNGPYAPENCKWATRTEQGANKRNTRLYTLNGETLCMAEWARRLGVDGSVLSYRLAHMPLDKALTKKVHRK